MVGTEIYYFSGTGNSLHVAQELQKRLPRARLVPILGFVERKSVTASGDTVGFVFPHYASTLPKVVHAFIEKLDLGSARYLFAIATRGSTKTWAMWRPRHSWSLSSHTSSGSVEGSRALSNSTLTTRVRAAVSASGCVSPQECEWSTTGRCGLIWSDVTAVSHASASARKGQCRSGPSGICDPIPSRMEGTTTRR
jgi:hypothetical protein